MKENSLLPKAISTVVVLLGAFGSVALNIQPPGDGIQKLLSFIVSFGALIILLVISAIANVYIGNNKLKKVWIVVGATSFIIFLVIGFTYNANLIKYRVEYPHGSSERYIVGDSLASTGTRVKTYLISTNRTVTNYNLIQNGGGIDNIKGIWTEASVANTTKLLMQQYIFLMIMLPLSVFSIVEGVFSKEEEEEEERPLDQPSLGSTQ